VTRPSRAITVFGRPQRSRQPVRAWEIDPLRTSAHHGLIRVQLRLGRTTDVAEQYRLCHNRLQCQVDPRLPSVVVLPPPVRLTRRRAPSGEVVTWGAADE
jgi:hypothetical protein